MDTKKKLLALILSTVMLFAFIVPSLQAWHVQAENNEEPEDFGPVPNQSQLDYYREELAAFMHYGPNTFTGLEWGNASYTVNSFQGHEFHAKEMVDTLQQAGFKRLIVTAKHHDGFCLWNSAFTDFDVESSVYDGDILAELSKACTDANMNMGLYLSPWDIHEPSYGYGWGGSPNNDKNGDYNEFYINQIHEINKNDIYGNNGHFVEWWMDGAKGEGTDAQEYDFPKIIEAIKEDNEGIQVFGAEGVQGGIHWIGNERGIASDNEWHQKVDNNGVRYWSVPECDVSLIGGWFHHDGYLPKTMEHLATIYFSSVGRGCPLLLNVPPNKQGRFTKENTDRLLEFGQAIKDTFKEDFTQKEGVTVKASSVRGNSEQFKAENVLDRGENYKDTYWTMNDGVKTGSLEINLGTPRTFDVVSIEEHIEKGQRITDFTVQYWKDGAWHDFGQGKTIAAKRLVRSFPVTSDRIKITVNAKAVPLIDNVGVFKAVKAFEVKPDYPAGLKLIDDREFKLGNGWNKENQDNMINTTGIWSSNGRKASAEIEFTGSKFYVIGTKDPNHGQMEVYVDDVLVDTVNTHAGSRSTKQVLYASEDLEHKHHKVTLKSVSKPIGLDALVYVDKTGGAFSIEKPAYTVTTGKTVDVKIKRVGASNEEATVRILTPPGTAVQGQYYTDITDLVLTFAPNEKEKTVTVETKAIENLKESKEFYIMVTTPSDNATIGYNEMATIVINPKQTDGYNEDNPFDMPTKANQEPLRFEAEDSVLEMRVPGEVPNNQNKNVRIAEDSNASGGKKVSWFETGNKIHLHYDAPVAGVFTVTVRNQSGRFEGSENTLNWSGPKIQSGTAKVTASGNNPPLKDDVIEITVTEAGKGVITFTADENSSPNIDYFDFVLKTPANGN